MIAARPGIFNMANIFLTSDQHFGHEAILRFERPDRRVCSAGEQQCDEACKAAHPKLPVREFGSVQEMDEHMVERWNSVVRPQDKIYHLGDVTMHKRYLPILNRLNGHKRLVRGNHDDAPTKVYLEYFDEVYASRVLDHMLLTHIPIHPASMGRFDANIHGHIHNNAGYPPPYLNICVEVTEYTPISLDEARQRVLAWR